MARVIINSDDFGCSIKVNQAIVQAFKEGLISSTTMLVNFENGFENVKALISNQALPLDSIGIHLNLSEGSPLTTLIQECPRFCSNGSFHGKLRDRPIFFLSKFESTAVKTELEAQIQKFRTLGFYPSRIDSHHHVHTEWAIIGIVIQLARQYKIGVVRLSRNIGQMSKLKKMYKWFFNLRIRSAGLQRLRYFGDLNDVIDSGHTLSIEVMVHALYAHGTLVDLDGKCLAEKIRKAFPEKTSIEGA